MCPQFSPLLLGTMVALFRIMKRTENGVEEINQSKNGGRDMDMMVKFLKEENGSSVLEYGLLAALLAGVIMAAVSVLGQTIGNTFNTISNSMNTAS